MIRKIFEKVMEVLPRWTSIYVGLLVFMLILKSFPILVKKWLGALV